MSIRQKTLQALATAGVVALALFLAGCGGGPAGPTEGEQLMSAQEAARAASQAAVTAATAARTAADRIAGEAGADSGSAMMAEEAAMMAEAAAAAAQEAATMAADATTSADARTYQESAEGQQMTAEEQLAAVMAIEDSDAYAADVAAAIEMSMLMTAQEAANAASQAAMTAATNARAAADRIAGLVAQNSDSAMMAEEAAMMAEEAAVAAQEAAMMAAGAMTSADAQTHQESAKGQQMTAEEQLAAVMAIEDSPEFTRDIAANEIRKDGVAAAKAKIDAAVMAAEEARDAAEMAAVAAETARDDAQAEIAKARMARTDVASATAQYEAAMEAATMARTAADNAQTAYNDAVFARYDVFDEDGSVADAENEVTEAEAAQMRADAAKMTAEMQKEAAESARMMAMAAVDMHVLEVFISANGQDIMETVVEDDSRTSDIDETELTVEELRAAETGLFAEQLAVAATGGINGLNGKPRDTTESTPTNLEPSIMIMWPAADEDMSIEYDAHDVTGDSDSIPDLDTTATATVTPEEQVIVTEIDGIGKFMHGFDMLRMDEAQDKSRVILFTNKQQGTAYQPADPPQDLGPVLPGRFVDRPIGAGAVMFSEMDVSPDGRTISNVKYFTDSTETADERLAYTGKLTCPATTACSYEVLTSGDIDPRGYVFTGKREAHDMKKMGEDFAGTEEMENDDYLAFGLWLREDSVDHSESFGAFADGGRLYPTGDNLNQLNGQATYSGSAVGAHHKDGKISFFDADASVTLVWDLSNPSGWGRALGEISNIRVAGGDAMSESIYLSANANGNIFSGDAVMGTESVPGADDYEFSGGWEAKLYGVDQADSHPDGVAGTFGVSNADDTETFVGAYGVTDPVIVNSE